MDAHKVSLEFVQALLTLRITGFFGVLSGLIGAEIRMKFSASSVRQWDELRGANALEFRMLMIHFRMKRFQSKAFMVHFCEFGKLKVFDFWNSSKAFGLWSVTGDFEQLKGFWFSQNYLEFVEVTKMESAEIYRNITQKLNLSLHREAHSETCCSGQLAWQVNCSY